MRSYTPPDAILVPECAHKVFSGVIFDVYQWQQEMFDGSMATFEMAKRADTVEVIALHDDHILLSKEEQPYLGEYTSLPAGMHDKPEENELAAAKRELKEETGHVFKNWKLIHAHQVGTGKIEHLVYTFLATDLEEIVSPALDVGERIEVVRCPFREFAAPTMKRDLRFYPKFIMDSVTTLEDLVALPSLYDYGTH